jgi:hypothetical protein
MRTASSVLLALILLASACDDQDQKKIFCEVNSIEDLNWLQEEIENGNYESSEIMDVSVYQTTYNGRTVIVTVICCPVCGLRAPDVKDCNGTILGQLGVNIDSGIINKGKIIWRTHNDVCD